MSNLYKAPKSELVDESVKKHRPHGFWKVFFWVHVLFSPIVIFTAAVIENINIMDYIDLATFPIILTGLYGYAFSKRIKPLLLWKSLCYLYPLWFVFFEFISPFFLMIPQYGEPAVVDGWLLLSPIFGIPTCILFYLYSFKAKYVWNPP